MYYVINDLENPSMDEDEENAPFLEIHEELLTNPRQGWHSGTVLADPPSQPIFIEATQYFGFQGPPADYYDDSISLLSPRLRKTLEAAGVDTIDYYPAVITYRGTGQSYEWYAFNIVRALKSQQTYEEKLFRLAESLMTTLVSEEVKLAIEAAGIHTFGFVLPEDWAVVV